MITIDTAKPLHATTFSLATQTQHCTWNLQIHKQQQTPPPPPPPHPTYSLRSSQVKHTPQDSINEMIVWKMNQLVIVDFSFISSFLHEQ